MTLAFWAILVACVLPVVCAGIAKWGAKGLDNAAPRDWGETLTGWRRRADWAQRNHHEALPPFIAGVMVASLAHAPHGTADMLACAFIAIRIAYTAAYIFNRPSIRSLLWSLGFACVVALFAISA